jgi:hypothetical protein
MFDVVVLSRVLCVLQAEDVAMKQKKNVTTIVLVSLALSIFLTRLYYEWKM